MKATLIHLFSVFFFSNMALASSDAIIAPRKLPKTGDIISYDLSSHVEQGASTCDSSFSLVVTASQPQLGVLSVSSHMTQTAGSTGCGKPKNALKTWRYIEETKELIGITECKTEDLATCADRQPIASDQWQSPHELGECHSIGVETISLPIKDLDAEHFSCDLSVNLVSGKSVSQIWINEAVYEPYPLMQLTNQIELPDFKFKMTLTQKLISVVSF